MMFPEILDDNLWPQASNRLMKEDIAGPHI